jgi:hypothetical protein
MHALVKQLLIRSHGAAGMTDDEATILLLHKACEGEITANDILLVRCGCNPDVRAADLILKVPSEQDVEKWEPLFY